MRRDALAVMFRRIVMAAALPLVGGGCVTGGGPCSPEQVVAVVDAGVGDGGSAPSCQALCQAAAGYQHQPGSEPCTLASDGGVTTVSCTAYPFCPGGRRPEGLRAPLLDGGDSVGAWLARLAHLEEASITAFERMRAELDAHGAPRALLDGAARAARDEVRHARVVGALARRRGVEPAAVELEPARARSLGALALENAVEGCVREAYGALVATWQGEHAGDADLRAAFVGIARDEARHAELAFAVDAWVRPLLDEAERRAVHEATRSAIATLLRELDAAPDAALIARAGLPSPESARALLDGAAALWS